MASRDLVRWGGLAAIAGGAAWAVDNRLVAALGPQAAPSAVLLVAAEVLLAAGLLGLHALQRGGYGRLGTVGLYVAVAAFLAQALGVTAYVLGSNSLNWLAFPAGYLAMLAGLVLYGVATLRAGVLPRWCGAGLVVLPVTTVLGGYGGILFGLFWLALGYALWSRRGAPAHRPSRVG